MNMFTYSLNMRKQRGLSLIELLIALALSLAVMAGLASVYVATKQSFRFQETTGRLQEDAGYALDTVAKDLRMAGYAGCLGINKDSTPTYYPGSVITTTYSNVVDDINPLAVVTGLTGVTAAEVTAQPFTGFNFLHGFDGVTGGMFSGGGAPSGSTGDSLFFAGAGSKSAALSAAMVTATDSLSLVADSDGWATPANTTRTFIVSRCAASTIFRGQVSGTPPSLSHTAGMGNSGTPGAVSPFNTPFSPNTTLFGTDAVVNLAQWHYYYVATRSGASTPSLYHVFFDGSTRLPAEEVIANVETMRLYYGEDTSTGTPTWIPDTWRTTAASVTDWSRVVAVRIGVMMVSSDDNANPGVTMTAPTLLGATYTIPTASANRLHKEFSTTVVLRNRAAAR